MQIESRIPWESYVYLFEVPRSPMREDNRCSEAPTVQLGAQVEHLVISQSQSSYLDQA
jgi:hypothetical protein